MIRHPKQLSSGESASTVNTDVVVSGDFPKPCVVRPERYWVHKTQLADVETDETIPPESIDFVQTLDRHKTWESLRLPILCSICTDQTVGENFHLDKTHWAYLHCPKCRDFFVCGRCFKDPSADVVSQLRHHASHEKSILVQSRPLWMPPHNGNDLAQLEAFKAAGSDYEFFLYFPWHFHCFQGLETVQIAYQLALVDELRACIPLETPRTDAMARFLRAPLDWCMRIFAVGNWREFHQLLQPLIDDRIQAAKTSAALGELLERLRGFVDDKMRQYGPGDIPCLPSAHRLAAGLWNDDNYNIYLIPMHVMTVLNDAIDMQKIDDMLHKDYRSQSIRQREPQTERTLVSAGDSGLFPAGSTSHLSNAIGTEGLRLWPMFKLLFEDDVRFKSLKGPTQVNDLGTWVQFASIKSRTFLDRDCEIRELLYQTRYINIDPEVAYLTDPTALEDTRARDLAPSPRQRILGNYLESITHHARLMSAMRIFRLPHLDVILEIQLTFIEQGLYKNAADCIGYLADPANMESIRDCTAVCIVALAKYARCFTHGEWKAALEFIPAIFYHFRNQTPETLCELLHQVQLELIFHRTVLAVYRDIRKPCPLEKALIRLKAIRDCLAKFSEDPAVVDLLWQTVSLELEMRKRSVRKQYLEHENCFSMNAFVHTPRDAEPVLNEFAACLTDRDDVSKTVRGHVSFVQAEPFREMGLHGPSMEFARQAQSLYEDAGCESGCLDVKLFHARGNYAEIGPIYDRLRAKNDLARLRLLRERSVRITSEEDVGAISWRQNQRSALRDLAAEAGDNISFHRWNMRQYAGDAVVGASVQSAEAVTEDLVVHSTILTTLASFNLSKAYLTLGNYFLAALNAMLHLSLVSGQEDAEAHQRGVLAVLDVLSAAIAAEPKLQQRAPQLAQHWKGWLNDITLYRWDAGHVRCDEVERFVDGACFLPLVAGHIARKPERGILSRDPEFEEALVNHLRIALDLYSALPTYVASAIVPRLASALGATAAYIRNSNLAIRGYWEGVRCAHSEDIYTIARLRLDAGKLMVELGGRDPEHCLHVVAPGRSLLQAAANDLQYAGMAGGMFKAAEANMRLLMSLLDEARAFKRAFDREADLAKAECKEELIEAMTKKLASVATLIRKTTKPIWSNESVFATIAMHLNIASPFALNYNLVALAQNPFFTETRQLAFEVGLLSMDLEDLENKQRGAALWKMVQHFKGTVLSHRCGQRIPEQLLKRIQENPEAWRLYQEEQRIIKEGPQSRMDYRLQTHQAKMSSCPELKALIERRLARGITMEQATSLVTKTVRWSKTVIMVDWFLYRGYFFILGYNATAGKLCMIDHIEEPTCTVPELENWIERNLNVEGDMLLQTLETSRELWKLHHLTDAIRLNCSPGDALIFSPTLCLNRIPLHAIPYKDQNDHPIIHYHPVIYVPSGGILKECVERSLDVDPRAQVRAKLFDFYDRDEEEYVGEQMGELAAVLSEMGAETTVTARNGIGRTALVEVLTDADIVHFHGHVNGQNLDKYLVLGDDNLADASASRNSNDDSVTQTHPSSQGQEPQPSAPGGFGLQDVYAVTMHARLVLLMGCGSSELEVSRGDDALGLVNGFLAAGAATVIGTLWPFGTDSARVFSRHFYRNAFGRDVGDGASRALSAKDEAEEDADGDEAMQLVDMAVAMQESVRTMRQCMREKCVKRRSPDARLTCHRVPPYEWAPFVAWGSWVYRISS